MGYYTDFKLTHDDPTPDANHEQHIGVLADYPPTCGYDFGPFGQEVKWYDCDEDMIAYSKLYPNVMFEVDGVGEDEDDIWRAYYKNGKMAKYYAEIKFPEFNEEDMQ